MTSMGLCKHAQVYTHTPSTPTPAKAKRGSQVSEMAQQREAVATKPDRLDSIPRTHTVKGENQFL